MADYHCSVKAISRAKGRSAVAAAAYRQAIELTDERIGEVHDYTRKAGVEHSELVLPEIADLPEWARDREKLWNAAEKAEIRKDAKVAREWEIALPHELTPAQRRELAVGYAQHLANRYGIAVDVAIHAPARHGDERNHHAHLLATTRRIGPDGLGEKTRVLDSPRTSGAEVEHCRAVWATLANQALRMAGHDIQVDHRSLKAQRAEVVAIANDTGRPEPERRLAEVAAIALDREPTQHLGAKATAMERDGIQTGRGDDNRAIRAENAERRTLLEQIRDWGRQVKERAFDLVGRVVGQVRQWTPEQREALDTARLYQDGAKAAREAWDRIVHEAASRGIAPQQHPDVGKFNAIVLERDRVATVLMLEPERYVPHMPGADWERIEAHADAHDVRHLQQRRAQADAARDRAEAAKMERAVYDRIREQRQRKAAFDQRCLEEKAQGRDPVAAFQALSQLQRQAQEQGQQQRAEDIQKQMQQRAQDIQRTGQMDRLRQQDAQAAQQAQQMARTQNQGRGWR